MIEHVSVYRDCWLQVPSYSHIISQKTLPETTMVFELITASGAWKEALIQANFLSHEADLSLEEQHQIP